MTDTEPKAEEPEEPTTEPPKPSFWGWLKTRISSMNAEPDNDIYPFF